MQYKTLLTALLLGTLTASVAGALPTYAAHGSNSKDKHVKNTSVATTTLNIKLPLLAPSVPKTQTQPKTETPSPSTTKPSTAATGTPQASTSTPPNPGSNASSTPPVAGSTATPQKPDVTSGNDGGDALAATAAAPEHGGWVNPYAGTDGFTPLQSAGLLLVALILALAGTLFVQGVALERAYDRFVRMIGIKAPPRAVRRHA